MSGSLVDALWVSASGTPKVQSALSPQAVSTSLPAAVHDLTAFNGADRVVV